MKSPVEAVRGRIVGYDERRGELLIRAPYTDWPTMVKRGYKEVHVELIDSRNLSDKQRKICWSLVSAISDWTGETKSEASASRKLDFLINELGENAERLFSLSNAPMSLVAAYQRYLIRFIVSNGIPTAFPLLEYVDDIGDYVYACMIAKTCAVCGRHADLHHIDRVGMGRSRTDICHEGMEALPLCRDHHSQAHTMPDSTFFDLYHLDGGIVLDKTLCRIWKLKRSKPNAE